MKEAIPLLKAIVAGLAGADPIPHTWRAYEATGSLNVKRLPMCLVRLSKLIIVTAMLFQL